MAVPTDFGNANNDGVRLPHFLKHNMTLDGKHKHGDFSDEEENAVA